ncbi:MAG: branched-chain amino acid ABC transporter permease, partial [Phycisphaerales bacterium]
GEIVRVMIQQTNPTLKTAEEVAAAPLFALPAAVGGSLGFTGIPKYTSLFWVYLVAGVTVFTAYRLKLSTFGRAFLSIREDEIAAEAMGVNTTRYKVWAFVIAAFFAGVAGGLFAHTLGVGLSAETAGFLKSFDIIIMVVLGGLGSISGAAIAAVIVTLLPEALRDIPQFRLIIYALALVLIMIFRPKGLFGVHEVWDRAEWRWVGRLLRRGGPKAGGGS